MTDLICLVLLALSAFGVVTSRPRRRPMAEAVRLNPGLAKKGW